MRHDHQINGTIRLAVIAAASAVATAALVISVGRDVLPDQPSPAGSQIPMTPAVVR